MSGTDFTALTAASTQFDQLLKGVMGQRFGSPEQDDDSDPSQTPDRDQ